MAKTNGYASLVKQRSSGETKRRKLDDYETPPAATGTLLEFVKFKGDALEPAAGTGRMVRALKEFGYRGRIAASDIKQGKDKNFLNRTRPFAGNIITNPPYRDGLAEAFARHALKLADGKVAMLMQSGFLWGSRRASGLYADNRPEAVIVIPDRVYFFEAGKQIESQFFSHCWIVWPERKKRGADVETRVYWGSATEF